MPNPQEVRCLSLNLSADVGTPDSVVHVRVVPDGRAGNVVYARTLGPGDVDPGDSVIFNPEDGEHLHFRPGRIVVSLADVESRADTDANGYRFLTPTLWSWLTVVAPTRDASLLRYLLAAARRLDSSNELFRLLNEALEQPSHSAQQVIAKVSRALGFAELMTVALSRAMDMLIQIPRTLAPAPEVPLLVSEHAAALRAMRNAFEHIEDRALGNVRGRPAPAALSIFDQGDLFRARRLTYAQSSLELDEHALPLLLAIRGALLRIALQGEPPVRWNTQEVVFPGVPKG